jgi:hypothetical protein
MILTPINTIQIQGVNNGQFVFPANIESRLFQQRMTPHNLSQDIPTPTPMSLTQIQRKIHPHRMKELRGI